MMLTALIFCDVFILQKFLFKRTFSSAERGTVSMCKTTFLKKKSKKKKQKKKIVVHKNNIIYNSLVHRLNTARGILWQEL